VILKLAKKNDKAVLVFEIKAYVSFRNLALHSRLKFWGLCQTNAGHPLQVNHDVGVFVLAPAKVKELREPCCPTPDVGHQAVLHIPRSLPLALHHSAVACDVERTRNAALASRAAGQYLWK
jgi:hypothetical protein